jgi:uncharacterized protein
MSYKREILRTLVGSHAYGTATPESDRDELSVFLAGPEHYLGLQNVKNSQKLEDGEDVQEYEFRHFVRLALNFNPNVVVALFVRPEDRLYHSIFGRLLLNNRYNFISKKVYATFCGYAHSQRNRMLGSTTGQMGAKRKELKDTFGYDTKYAYHTVRLLRMCHECLNTGELNVYRIDGEDLYKIRNGEFDLPQVETIIEFEKLACEAAMVTTKLPEEPDYEVINKMVMDAIFEHCSQQREKSITWL